QRHLQHPLPRLHDRVRGPDRGQARARSALFRRSDEMMRLAGAVLLILGTVASAAHAQPAACLDVAGRAVMKSRLDISLTPAGKSALKASNAPLVFVHAIRMIDGETSPEYVQMLGSSAVLIDPKDRSSVSFWFGHEGNYCLSLRGADSYGWPYFDQVGA